MEDDSATKADEDDRGKLQIGDMALVEKGEAPLAALLKRPRCHAGGNEKGRDRDARLNELVRVKGRRLTAQQRDRVIDKKQPRYDGQYRNCHCAGTQPEQQRQHRRQRDAQISHYILGEYAGGKRAEQGRREKRARLAQVHPWQCRQR